MRITAVEEYGLRCLLNLARGGIDKQMSISEIAENEGLSVPYASKLLSILRKQGLVTASRGRSGGFHISRLPEQITLYEVLTALGGPLIDPNHCSKYSGQLEQCVHIDYCTVHDVLGGLAGYIQTFLTGTTIKEIIDGLPVDFRKHPEAPFEISDKALEGELSTIEHTEKEEMKSKE